VGALFAATIVYGRFAQDNELMACRASGLCTLRLMVPALVLAGVVSAATLALGLYVAPKLGLATERSIKSNLEKITYHSLKSKGHINITKQHRLFHADRVDEDSKWIYGVVLIRYDDEGGAKCLVASSAKLEFAARDGRTSAMFHFTNPVIFSQAGGTEIGEDEQPFTVLELEGSLDDEPRLYGWKELWDTLRRPAENPFIRRRSREIRRELVIEMLCRDVVRAVGDRGVYAGLTEPAVPTGPAERTRVEVRAPAAWPDEKKGFARLGPPLGATATGRNVIVREFVGDQVSREFRAAGARIEGSWPEHERQAKISLTLTDVDVRTSMLAAQAYHRDEATLGPFAVPEDLVQRAQEVSLPDLAAHPASHNVSERVAAKARRLYDKEQARLLTKVRAEIHLRLSYGTSCFLMVLLGGALGLLWRGGQVLAAFAISAVPGAAVTIMLVMGRELIKSKSQGSDTIGVAVIWGGIALLALATGTIYARPLRR